MPKLLRDVAAVKKAVVAGFADVLRDNMVAIYAYGSGADGTFIAGFSDLDMAVFCLGQPSRDEFLKLHRRLEIDIKPEVVPLRVEV